MFQLHAATAAVGVSIAQEFPSLTLSGSLSRGALTASGLFHDFNSAWSTGGALAAPLFEGGALRAQARAVRDALAAQTASYQQVVLEALGQVADDLRSLDNDSARVSASRHALEVANEALRLQRTSYAQARLGLASAQIQQYEDTAGLLVALGGGWWNDRIGRVPAGAVSQ